MKARLAEYNPLTRLITFKVEDDCRSAADELKGKDIDLSFKQYRKRRSVSANAYAWALIDKVASKVRISKEEAYQSYIRNMGGNSDARAIENDVVEMFCRLWSSQGLGWFTELSPSMFEGYTDVIFYYGSSSFDTAQMSRFIDLIIQDCKSLGIETKDEGYINSLLEDWNGRQHHAG